MTNMTGSKLSIFSHPGKITGYWITTRSYLSDFKTVMLHFSSYELYIYFQIFIINVDILFIHDAYYMCVIIVRVRSGQEGERIRL
jgi:hypothetical protein